MRAARNLRRDDNTQLYAPFYFPALLQIFCLKTFLPVQTIRIESIN